MSAPTISLPKGGGAIRGIGEKFSANPVTGTGSMSVPIATSPGRGGFGQQLSLGYDSGAGQGTFGLGWSLSLPAISRKTDRGLPQYLDEVDSDTFILAGAEDLVPVLDAATGERPEDALVQVSGRSYRVRRYRPRVEGLFARIERWHSVDDPTDLFWRTISRDNVTSWFGRTPESRVLDPDQPAHVFQWMLCETHDDKGNVAVYRYQPEDGAGVDRTQPFEANRPLRTGPRQHAATYIARILYGNRTPYLPTFSPVGTAWPAPADDADDWMFEVLFDYGQYPMMDGPLHPEVATSGAWPIRQDPFSTHRAGFEVRTWRLCRRVLMRHHFPGEPTAGAHCLVKSTDFEYGPPTPWDLRAPEQPGYATLRSVTHRSYQRGPLPEGAAPGYHWREMPPVSFTYSRPVVGTAVQSISAEHLPNLPVGTQGPGYQWVDLDGEGLSGVLTEQAGAWHYAANRGDGRFAPTRVVAPLPATAALAGGSQQLMDLAGDGDIELVDFSGPTPGFHERDRDAGWKRHVPFANLPKIDWQDPNLRFVDLTGDGHADALVTEHEVFTWYASLEERGFAPAQRTRPGHDEEAGPRVVFHDGTQTLFLADMCGDGLTDLVRIRNGEICYWPNQGYGRFGRKVTMANAPRFDTPDQFDPQRLRLADIDGSGPVDLIYLGPQGARLYFNRGGNSFSHAHEVPLPVATANLGAVQVADLLGTGTACLVWNSHLPADATHPVRYVELMAEGKPHLLTKVDNHLGATTEIEYTPSTHFYLQDLAAGQPWVTRLPFPVHCVSRVTAKDNHRGTEFTCATSYHHGHFDGVEREFRGFGRVEQVDIDRWIQGPQITADPALHQPPVKTITWYHTGLADDHQRILGQFEREYFPSRHAVPGANGFAERVLPQPDLDPGPGAPLDAHEWREAMRACKGMVLRQEVYELDLAALRDRGEHRPVKLFTAAHHNCHIRRLQGRGRNPHAVFMALESEALTYHYELDLTAPGLLADPRVAHTLNLRFDAYGRAEQSVAAVYGRWGEHQDAQLRPEHLSLIRRVQKPAHLIYTETRYTDELTNPGPDAHRLPTPCSVQTFELTGIAPSAGGYLSLPQLREHQLSSRLPERGSLTVAALAYQDQPDTGSPLLPQKRLVEHVVTVYYRDDLSGPLDFGQPSRLGLTYETYKLALTETLLGDVLQGRFDAATRAALARTSGSVWPRARPGFLVSGYQTAEAVLGAEAPAENQWWMRSGVAGFDSGPTAASVFFLPTRYTDPFGNDTTLAYDAPHYLQVRRSTDALGNATNVAAFDYRVLAPARLVDVNDNVTEVAFDIRGLPVATALRGKVDAQTGASESGDGVASLGFDLLNPADDEVADFFATAPLDGRQARQWLGKATSRFVYHFGAPPTVGSPRTGPGACGIQRERHERDLRNAPTADPAGWVPVQMAFEYSDGGGRPLLTKAQAEPDPNDPTGALRWIVNGKVVLNNKGKPVKQFEPYFSAAGHVFEAVREEGVSATMFYDAPGRLVRTEFPDGTLARVVFTPWRSEAWDQNDTVNEGRWLAEPERSASHPDRAYALPLPMIGTAPSADARAGWLARQHANTPAQTHFDSQGREVIAIAHNRTPDDQGNWRDEHYLTFTRLDTEGKPLWIRDARGNLVMQYVTPAKPTRWADDPSEDPSIPDPNNPAGANRLPCKPCYDIAGNLLQQHSMDAGDRWMLMDAAGQPMLAWDENDRGPGTPMEKRLYRTDYDALHRPTAQWLTTGAAAPALIEAFDYCDTGAPRDAQGLVQLTQAQDRNLIGQAVNHWDPSGVATVERVGLQGSATHLTRRLILPEADGAAGVVDWSEPDRRILLERETFIHLTEFDALGRMVRRYNWHRDLTFAADGTALETQGRTNRVAVYVPTYNERGALRSELLHVRASKATTDNGVTFTPSTAAGPSPEAIRLITYNAKGQKLTLELGNRTQTRYTYDEKTFRLSHMFTRRPAIAFPGDCSSQTADSARPQRFCGVQNLHYTYDPVGNITHIQDDAQDSVFFSGEFVEPSNDYTYDAIYRLIEATGREHAVTEPPPLREGPWRRGSFPTNDQLRNYLQRYRYDEVGNFIEMAHEARGGAWTRHYSTQPDSNRLHQTWIGSNTGDAVTYFHDAHGSMLNLNRRVQPPDPEDWALDIQWDWRDMIRGFDLGGGGMASYHYGIDKQRTRKHITRGGGVVDDRIYLDGYELLRRRDAAQGEVAEEIESHHLFEGEQRVLLADDVIVADGAQPAGLGVKAQTLLGYQYANHLGSVGLELDEAARIISYEEFLPYGTSVYRLMNSAEEAPARRYRCAGVERDEESGLQVHGSRAYLSSSARWLSTDPMGVEGGLNLYAYCACAPVNWSDQSGNQPTKAGATRAAFLNADHFAQSFAGSLPSGDESTQTVLSVTASPEQGAAGPDEEYFRSLVDQYWLGIQVELGSRLSSLKQVGGSLALCALSDQICNKVLIRPLVEASRRAYSRDGSLGVINQFNPVYALLVSAYRLLGHMESLANAVAIDVFNGTQDEISRAVEDSFAMGRESVSLADSTIQTATIAYSWSKVLSGAFGKWYGLGSERDLEFLALSKPDQDLFELGQRTLPDRLYRDFPSVPGETVADVVARGAAVAKTRFSLWDRVLGFVNLSKTMSTGPTPRIRNLFPLPLAQGVALSIGPSVTLTRHFHDAKVGSERREVIAH